MQSLKGIFPRPKGPPKRDFIKENVKNLKSMQQHNHDLNDIESKKTEQRKTRSTSHSRLRSSKKNITSIENVSRVFEYGEKTRPLSVQSRDAYSQTESIDDDLFLKDVIIRIPSAKIRSNEQKINKESEFNFAFANCPANEQKLNTSEEVDNISAMDNFNEQQCQHNVTKREVDRPIHQFSSRCEHSLQSCAKDNSNVPTSYRKGEIPKYLKEMKFQEEERKRMASLEDVNCPPGHTALSDDERLETLEIAKKKCNELIDELNHMPLTSKTLRVRNRQIEIEKELRQLDNTMQIFSRSRVYVKNEE